MGAPPYIPPFVKSIEGRNINISTTDITILAFEIVPDLKEYRTYRVKAIAPKAVDTVADKGSCMIRPQGIAANRATSTTTENTVKLLSFILIEES